MFTEQQGAKELRKSAEKSHSQELTRLVTVILKERKPEKVSEKGGWENHDCHSIEEPALLQTAENSLKIGFLSFVRNKINLKYNSSIFRPSFRKLLNKQVRVCERRFLWGCSTQ